MDKLDFRCVLSAKYKEAKRRERTARREWKDTPNGETRKIYEDEKLVVSGWEQALCIVERYLDADDQRQKTIALARPDRWDFI